MQSNFPWVAIVVKVGVIYIYKYRVGGAFKQIVPIVQATHDCQEFPVINRIILFCCAELL